MDASKFQVNFLQLLLIGQSAWQAKVRLYIGMFIKEASTYKLESYETQY